MVGSSFFVLFHFGPISFVGLVFIPIAILPMFLLRDFFPLSGLARSGAIALMTRDVSDCDCNLGSKKGIQDDLFVPQSAPFVDLEYPAFSWIIPRACMRRRPLWRRST